VPRAHSGSVEDENAAQVERSGHWSSLRETATTLQTQLSAPIEQLLGLGECGTHNPYLVLESSGDQLQVALEVEEEPLFFPLRDHLPNYKAWNTLEIWRRQVKEIQLQLLALCQWVRSSLIYKICLAFLRESRSGIGRG
jgi:hypothetical protein